MSIEEKNFTLIFPSSIKCRNNTHPEWLEHFSLCCYLSIALSLSLAIFFFVSAFHSDCLFVFHFPTEIQFFPVFLSLAIESEREEGRGRYICGRKFMWMHFQFPQVITRRKVLMIGMNWAWGISNYCLVMLMKAIRFKFLSRI